MYFEIDRFLATLRGLTRQQSYKIIVIKKDELMSEISLPGVNKIKTLDFYSLKHNISFLHRLGIEIQTGFSIATTTSIDCLRINNVINNLSD